MDINIRHKGLIAAVTSRVKGPLERCGMLVEAEAKRLLSIGGGASGEPSVPPAPPHLQTGALRASVCYALTVEEGCIVGTTEIYGKWHEYGTEELPKRPFMRPALLNTIHRFPSQFEDIL